MANFPFARMEPPDCCLYVSNLRRFPVRSWYQVPAFTQTSVAEIRSKNCQLLPEYAPRTAFRDYFYRGRFTAWPISGLRRDRGSGPSDGFPVLPGLIAFHTATCISTVDVEVLPRHAVRIAGQQADGLRNFLRPAEHASSIRARPDAGNVAAHVCPVIDPVLLNETQQHSATTLDLAGPVRRDKRGTGHHVRNSAPKFRACSRELSFDAWTLPSPRHIVRSPRRFRSRRQCEGDEDVLLIRGERRAAARRDDDVLPTVIADVGRGNGISIRRKIRLPQ